MWENWSQVDFTTIQIYSQNFYCFIISIGMSKIEHFYDSMFCVCVKKKLPLPIPLKVKTIFN